LSLQSQALAARASSAALAEPEGVSGSSGRLAEREKTLDWRERQLRERESQVARREYEAQHAPAVGAEAFGPSQGARRIADRQSTGTPRLDDLLLGGMPPGAHVLLVGPPFTGKEVALYAFVAEGLKRGEAAVLVTASRPPEELAQEIGVASPQFLEYEQLGRVVWIDASNPSPSSESPAGASERVRVRGPGDHKGILSALTRAAMRFEREGVRSVRVGFLGLSASLAHGDGQAGFAFLQNFVGILKARTALALYVVDRGAITDTQVETVQARMDGALQFKSERGKTFLAVQGLGDVATREWVEYRATSRALAIGSFSLERIR
jgi:KaiC/GvpD/RAD55 family RecA-like ATPase